MLITDLKNHLKWFGNSYVIKTVYMVGREECIKIHFPKAHIKEVVEYLERLEKDGFRISCWAYWVWKKWRLWFRDRNKVAIRSKDGINVVIEEPSEDFNSTSLGTGVGC